MFESEINEKDQLINQLNAQLIISETPKLQEQKQGQPNNKLEEELNDMKRMMDDNMREIR